MDDKRLKIPLLIRVNPSEVVFGRIGCMRVNIITKIKKLITLLIAIVSCCEDHFLIRIGSFQLPITSVNRFTVPGSSIAVIPYVRRVMTRVDSVRLFLNMNLHILRLTNLRVVSCQKLLTNILQSTNLASMFTPKHMVELSRDSFIISINLLI